MTDHTSGNSGARSGDESGSTGEGAVDVPWDYATAPEWHSDVDEWPWRARTTGEWIKVGQCPRCHHSISVIQRGGVVAGSTGESIPSAPVRQVLARCNCREPHIGRPEGALGCGRYAQIEAQS